MQNHVSVTIIMVSYKKLIEKWIAAVTNFNKWFSQELHKFSKFQFKSSTYGTVLKKISEQQFPFSQNFELSQLHPELPQTSKLAFLAAVSTNRWLLFQNFPSKLKGVWLLSRIAAKQQEVLT